MSYFFTFGNHCGDDDDHHDGEADDKGFAAFLPVETWGGKWWRFGESFNESCDDIGDDGGIILILIKVRMIRWKNQLALQY